MVELLEEEDKKNEAEQRKQKLRNRLKQSGG